MIVSSGERPFAAIAASIAARRIVLITIAFGSERSLHEVDRILR
jgi:hypothetical protein